MGYRGLFGVLLDVLSCRELRPGTFESYVAVLWCQIVGSTMHCVVGDGVGILVADSALVSFHMPKGIDLAVEYVVGFAFGWMDGLSSTVHSGPGWLLPT